MNECMIGADRFVDVAHGRGGWTAAESSHLATCAECRAAWRLARAAAGLGSGLAPVPADRLAAAVRARLEADRAAVVALPRRRTWVRWAVPLAAAAALALAIGLGRSGSAEPEAAPAVIVELDDLNASELELVAEGYPAPVDVVMPVGAVGLSDLTPAEMERILVAWEG